MSNVVSKSDPLTSSEITLIENLANLAVSGPGEAIAKTGANTFANVTAGGSGGYTIETPTGVLYDQATATGGINFTATVKPEYIVADSGTYFENKGYTLSGLNITMFNPVSYFIRSFHL